MKIKVCGITVPEDAVLAVKLGATHIGCVLVEDSPRRVQPEQAREIFRATPRIAHVAVFHSVPAEAVIAAARIAGTRQVQLHAYDELEARKCEEAGLKVCRVFDVPSGSNMLPHMMPAPSRQQPAMLDLAGGASGLTFPWEILGSEAPPYTFISGGVRPENVCALLTHNPYGIDISEGLELTPGRKDPDRLSLFFDTLERGLA